MKRAHLGSTGSTKTIPRLHAEGRAIFASQMKCSFLVNNLPWQMLTGEVSYGQTEAERLGEKSWKK